VGVVEVEVVKGGEGVGEAGVVGAAKLKVGGFDSVGFDSTGGGEGEAAGEGGSTAFGAGLSRESSEGEDEGGIVSSRSSSFTLISDSPSSCSPYCRSSSS